MYFQKIMFTELPSLPHLAGDSCNSEMLLISLKYEQNLRKFPACLSHPHPCIRF